MYAGLICAGAACTGLLGACAATPALTGDALPAGVLTALDAGQTQEASELLRGASPQDRERAYPALYGEARSRFEAADYSDASRVLRLLVDGYPEAAAVREAYLYSLFLERDGQTEPRAELTRELEEGLASFAEAGGAAPHWIHLVEAQTAIDQDRATVARAAFQRFRSGWNGQPATLQPYVDDLDRYLASH